ncbi:MAG: hypothetical protein KDJ36_05250 [Hyphomicrobiaceae bacterium]|nr:hypothetical protein [Hyphomicrobiaceae bacterium]
MKRKQEKWRHPGVALFAFALATMAAAAPFVLNVSDREIELEPAGLFASGRDTYTIVSPIDLDRGLGTTITGGRLALLSPKGRELSGQQALRLIEQGVADLVLHRPDIAIGTRKTASAAHAATAPHVPIATALANGRFATLRVVGGSFAVTLPGGTVEQLDRVEAQFVKVGRHTMRGTGNGLWRGQKISFSLKTGAMANGTHELPLELKIRGSLLSVTFSGKIGRQDGLSLSGESTIASADIRRFARALGASWPDGIGLRNLSISGPISWSGQMLSFAKALVRFDDNSGAGTLSINTGGTRALATGTIAFDEFDIAPYLPGAKPQKSSVPARFGGWLSRLRGAWSMPAARLFDADLRVSMRQIRLGDHRIGRAATSLSIKNGTLLANLAELSFEGGSGSGALEMDFNGLAPRVTLRGRLVNVPISSFTSALFDSRSIEGRGSVTADLVAHGTSLRHMFSGISGTIDVDVPKGGRLALDLSAFDVHLKGLRQAGVPLHKVFARAQKGVTAVTSLKASLLLTGGRVSARSFVAHYKGRAAHLAGRVDLSSRLIDLRLLIVEHIPASGAPAAKAATPDRALSGSLTRVTGDWRSPHVAATSHLARWPELQRLLKPTAGPLSGRQF